MDKEEACKKILICSNRSVVVDRYRCLEKRKCSCLNKTIFEKILYILMV